VRDEVEGVGGMWKLKIAVFWDVMLHTLISLPIHLQDRRMSQARKKVFQIWTTGIRAISKLTGVRGTV
jgi:hypothetical protein